MEEKLKITTHQLGANWNKGFQVIKLGKMLDQDNLEKIYLNLRI